MAKFIELTGKRGKGKFVIVDDEDFVRVTKIKWHFDGRYAAWKPKTGKVYLHRFIMGKGKKDIDHINRDKLDCRKENLRFVTRSVNIFNKGMNKNNTSGIKGVYWHRGAKKWMVLIGNNYLGVFKNFNEAKAIAMTRYEILSS